MAERKSSQPQALEIAPIETRTIRIHIVGKQSLILNRLSQKTRFDLLAPQGKKTTAQKQSTLKHDPFNEFLAAPYTLDDPNAATYLALLSSAFKSAMATAALDLPGARKSQIGRLVWVEEEYTPVYGMPFLDMKPVRNSDVAHTPDIRTRVLLKEWACELRITFVESLIKAQAIVNLLGAAGLTVGVGDWRNEKGKGTHGQFKVVSSERDAEYRKIVTTGGRNVQIAAMDNPEASDVETQEMLSYWFSETKRRGFTLTEEVSGDAHTEEHEDESDEETSGEVEAAD